MYTPLPTYLAIGPSNIHGAGIIAKEDIPSDIIIGISHIYDPDFENDYIRTPLGGFINHSDNPNCKFVTDDEYKKLKTIKHINSQDELTCKYKWYNPTKK